MSASHLARLAQQAETESIRAESRGDLAAADRWSAEFDRLDSAMMAAADAERTAETVPAAAPRHRANVTPVTAPANPWRYVPTHRANVTPRPATVADERAAHRAASRMVRSDVA